MLCRNERKTVYELYICTWLVRNFQKCTTKKPSNLGHFGVELYICTFFCNSTIYMCFAAHSIWDYYHICTIVQLLIKYNKKPSNLGHFWVVHLVVHDLYILKNVQLFNPDLFGLSRSKPSWTARPLRIGLVLISNFPIPELHNPSFFGTRASYLNSYLTNKIIRAILSMIKGAKENIPCHLKPIPKQN